jgi:hypothetical protein
MLQCTKVGGKCEEIKFKQYMNHYEQISMFIWNKIVREEKGYAFHLTTEHIFSQLCEPGIIWKP